MTAAIQLGLELPATEEEFGSRMHRLGLDGGVRVSLTENRSTMVSYGDGWVRVHRGYAAASDDVVRAIVRFVQARGRTPRLEARRLLMSYPVLSRESAKTRRRERSHPADAELEARLTASHGELNEQFFGGALRALKVRVSRRMRRKLGHYALAGDGLPAEITLSRRHLRTDSWADVTHTLLHEMVHQWQDESALAVAHDRAFRAKAREVGIDSRAVRRDSAID